MVGSEMHKQLSMHGNTFAFAPNADGTNNVPTGNLMAGWLLKLPVQDPSKHGESTNSGFWSRFHQKKDQRSSIAHSRDDAFPEVYAKVKPEKGIADLTAELAAEARAAGRSRRAATSPARK